MCHALAEVVVLDFRGTEDRGTEGTEVTKERLRVRGWGTKLIYELRYIGGVQEVYILQSRIGDRR
jgi:hypothetical protein